MQIPYFDRFVVSANRQPVAVRRNDGIPAVELSVHFKFRIGLAKIGPSPALHFSLCIEC